MPILREFERRLGGLVEGLFAKTFRSGLQPVELAKRVLKEMDAGRSVGVSEVWAPNAFVFRLSPFDAERFQQAEAALVSELKEVVNRSGRAWVVFAPYASFEMLNSPAALDYIHEHGRAEFESYRAKVYLIEGAQPDSAVAQTP